MVMISMMMRGVKIMRMSAIDSRDVMQKDKDIDCGEYNVTWSKWVFIFPPQRVQDAGQRQIVDVVARHVFVRAGLTKPSETRVDKSRILFRDNLRTFSDY